MGKALLVGNGFTSQLISEYTNSHMMGVLKQHGGVLFTKANRLFIPFRKGVPSARQITVGMGRMGKNHMGQMSLAPPIVGLQFNKELVAHIEYTLSVLGSEKAHEMCERNFLTNGLIYETQYSEISSVESLLKVVSLFTEMGKFEVEMHNRVIALADMIYYNEGNNRLSSVPSTAQQPIRDWLTDYDWVFTTNYDCVLDDACESNKLVMHLHGGFYFKDKFNLSNILLPADEAFLVWGISGEQKLQQMQGGFEFIEGGVDLFPFESPLSLFDQYLNAMKYSNITEFDIFGYSGENDQHINKALSENKCVERIRYFCNPAEVHKEEKRFEIKERFYLEDASKLVLMPWTEIWSRIPTA